MNTLNIKVWRLLANVGEAFNKPADPTKHVPKCPKEKEMAIIDALKAFRMLAEDVEYKEEAAE